MSEDKTKVKKTLNTQRPKVLKSSSDGQKVTRSGERPSGLQLSTRGTRITGSTNAGRPKKIS